MCDSYTLETNFKIGVVKELHKKGLVSESQRNKAIQILINKETDSLKKGANEK